MKTAAEINTVEEAEEVMAEIISRAADGGDAARLSDDDRLAFLMAGSMMVLDSLPLPLQLQAITRMALEEWTIEVGVTDDLKVGAVDLVFPQADSDRVIIANRDGVIVEDSEG
jgi:hypothetical protein